MENIRVALNKAFGFDVNYIHFIGIGGISMSGLAEILYNAGVKISGSDTNESEITERLRQRGMEIFIGQREENVKKGVDLAVYTAAVKPDNPEIAAAVGANIKIVDRACLLGVMMQSYKYSIAVSGTHGKTTVTSMVTEILLKARVNPTISLGGVLPSINGSFRIGGYEYFVLEACEYFDSFLKFHPFVGIILNVEEDHLDYFKNLAHIESSFNGFAMNIPKEGYLVVNNEMGSLSRVIKGLKCNVLTFGKNGDFTADNISYDKNGHSSFDVYVRGEFIIKVRLNLVGLHNVNNAVAAFAAAYSLGISPEVIAQGLANFNGTDRRFEFKGMLGETKVIDDYAHHPTEIKATLKAARAITSNKICVIFQPHTYTRTQSLMGDFATAFEDADEVIVLDIYSAREKNVYGIHSTNLADEINKTGKPAKYFPSFESCQTFLLNNFNQYDLLITMGAGNVHMVGENILCTGLSTLSTE